MHSPALTQSRLPSAGRLPSKQHQTLVLRLEHRTLERAIDFEQAGADVNHVDWGGFSALHRAAFDGQVEAAKVLLDAGAKVNCQDVVGGRTPLHQAAGCPLPRFPFQCGYMITNGSICRTTAGSIREEVLADDQGVLARAGEGQTKMCELLIARGADAHIKDYPCTPEVRWRGPLREGEASGLDLSAVCPCITRALNVSTGTVEVSGGARTLPHIRHLPRADAPGIFLPEPVRFDNRRVAASRVGISAV